MISKWVQSLVIAASAVGGWAPAFADRYNLPQPQTVIARDIYDLHTLIFLICCVIFVVVFGAMFYAIYKHRKSVGHQAEQFHENTTVEIVWTVIPFLILIGMAYPATKVVIAMKDTSSPDMTIKVTGYQWKWGYEYLQDGVSFYSTLATPSDQLEGRAPKGEHYLLEVDNPMVVPTGKKIRIILTANDVIHAWWVPALGVKQDAIPGFVRDTWFNVEKPGTYRGQCAELCGKDHGFMPIVVEAVEPEKYAAWVKDQKIKMAAAGATVAAGGAADGKAIYDKVCFACHTTGVLNAPKIGDKAGWQARLRQGTDTLYVNAIKGIRQMPPKGGAVDLPDAQIKAAVDYMLTSVK